MGAVAETTCLSLRGDATELAEAVAVAATVVCLALAIRAALGVGEHYDLEAAGIVTPIHLWIAKVTTAAYLLPVVTGVLTWRNDRWRNLHGKLAFVVLALTVVTTATGSLMLLWAEPITP